jgi:predicted TIM-barrel enzyme
MPRFLAELKDIGFSGVQNFPTVGLFEGRIRANLEETGMGFDREVEMIRIAHELDLLTTPYAFTADEAVAMTKAGADVVVAHVGTTVAGTVGAKDAMSLDEAVMAVSSMFEAVKAIDRDRIVICHGGPIADPSDAQYVLSRVKGLAGFYGASSMERLPVEIAITDNARRFKALTIA